jgi:hypothetical protein
VSATKRRTAIGFSNSFVQTRSLATATQFSSICFPCDEKS